jgi:hypothetical protein
MAFARKILSKYRTIQYKLLGRSQYAIMPAGVLCSHEPFEEEINYGDVVHPCVRYIHEGFEGHKWWMVYTPYYASNDKTENPILCYAEDNSTKPPIFWKIYCQVQGQPPKGYNSDPSLLFDKGKLYVMWRENLTLETDKYGFARASFCGLVHDGKIQRVAEPLVGTVDPETDPETSPTFMANSDGTYTCYAMNLRFHSKTVKKMPSFIKKLLLVIDLLGFWSEQKSFGIAQWEGVSPTKAFKLKRTVRFQNLNKLYRPWHMDIFDCVGKRFAIVQTNQSNADLCLAESSDGINFYMFNLPLMTNATSSKIGIYKPCAGVVDDTFYLYYTAQDNDNRKLNKLYLTTTSWDLLQKQLR